MSSRARVIAITALVAVAAAGTAVGGALLQGGTAGGEAHGDTASTNAETTEAPALELALTDRDDALARALREAERLYETGRVDDARRRFAALLARNPESTEAAVGAAITAWPNETIDRLEAAVRSAPGNATARLNLGLALVAEGRLEDARREWRAAEQADPDSAAALRADDLLHPEMPPGRPQFALAAGFPGGFARLSIEEQLRRLEQAARRGGAVDWLRYGSLLEERGRRVSARRAYERAAALAPKDPAARTAAALALFDKDDPSAAFARLGPLAAEHPDAAVVRYHLGLALLWLPDLRGARRQFELAVDAAPNGFYGREARRILDRLADVE